MTGKTLFYPEVEVEDNFLFFKGTKWMGIVFDGEVVNYDWECQNRADALKCIDLHFAGNSTIKSIEFEYVVK